MRVIGGQSKGKRLMSPRGLKIRPTAGKVKEALFSILADRINGARVLDLFAGLGSVGIEALSRGAARVDFVEQDPESLRFLKENLDRCGLSPKGIVHPKNIYSFLKRLKKQPELFDIIFVDPPYHTEILRKLLPLLSRGDIITPAGVMVIEHFHKLSLPDSIGAFVRSRTQRYGDTLLSFYHLA